VLGSHVEMAESSILKELKGSDLVETAGYKDSSSQRKAEGDSSFLTDKITEFGGNELGEFGGAFGSERT